MYLNILDSERQKLLKSVIEMPTLRHFYLAGGTALSLQMGLRESYDFDFFTEHKFNEAAALAAFRDRFPNTSVIHVESDTCDVLVNRVQISLFRYPYPMVSDLACGEGAWCDLKMAGIDDIAVMKWAAIGSRGARKDFYDLYQIYRMTPDFDSARLWKNAHDKYGENFSISNMIMGLNYFDDAEGETLPRTFADADWNEIKVFFREVQRQMIALEEARIKAYSFQNDVKEMT